MVTCTHEVATVRMKLHCCLLIFQNYVLKKLLTKRKVNSQISKVEIKLILLTMHYSLFEIMGVAFYTYLYNNLDSTVFFDVTKYFSCESTGESDCQQHLRGSRNPIAILLSVVFITWSLSPIMSILLKINVFNRIKNCFQRTPSKEPTSLHRANTRLLTHEYKFQLKMTSTSR